MLSKTEGSTGPLWCYANFCSSWQNFLFIFKYPPLASEMFRCLLTQEVFCLHQTKRPYRSSGIQFPNFSYHLCQGPTSGLKASPARSAQTTSFRHFSCRPSSCHGSRSEGTSEAPLKGVSAASRDIIVTQGSPQSLKPPPHELSDHPAQHPERRRRGPALLALQRDNTDGLTGVQGLR